LTGRATGEPLGNQKLKLGLFAFNCSGGFMMIKDSPLQIAWDEMLAIAVKAEALDFEVLLPVARWRGYGGEADYHGISFEPFTWAAGLAAATQRIRIGATVHTPVIHPVVAAKMATTVDHISQGRLGLNLVMGWFEPEMQMLGIPQLPHDERYDYGREWLEIASRIWDGGPSFDYNGNHFQLTDVRGAPTPVQRPRPLIFNAGTSRAGMDFASREADFVFGSVPDAAATEKLARDVRSIARERYNRQPGLLTTATIICRDSEDEAQAAYQSLLDRGDWAGAQNAMDILGIHSGSFDASLREFQARFVVGFGTQMMIGTPEQVATELKAVSDAGSEGVLLGFENYVTELDYFGRSVVPLLKDAGLRH
jgi:alkanesulfonate monooxygenase SsuD/methylene tetrahydromethanopterin reductase-like flavin-dependent oxidoreductase (luciferase family)